MPVFSCHILDVFYKTLCLVRGILRIRGLDEVGISSFPANYMDHKITRNTM